MYNADKLIVIFMKTVSSRQAQKTFGQILNDAQHEVLNIERYGNSVAVIMSKRKYDQLLEVVDDLEVMEVPPKVQKSLNSLSRTAKKAIENAYIQK